MTAGNYRTPSGVLGPTGDLPTVYLDTCIISGLVKDDMGDVEGAGVRWLLDAHKAQRLRLVTSRVSVLELQGRGALASVLGSTACGSDPYPDAERRSASSRGRRRVC